MNGAPAIGAFIRRDGAAYAIEVTQVFPPADNGHPRLPRVQGRRWGFKDGHAFNDGYRGFHGLCLRNRGPGYWTAPDYWNPMPEVWREVPGPGGQQSGPQQPDLFGVPA